MRIRSTGVLLVLCLAAAPLMAQGVASALLRESDPVAGVPGHAVGAINNPAVNHVGGYSFTMNSSDGTTTLSHAWGNAAGGPGAVIRSEGIFGDYEQMSWESFFGMSDAGQIAYSPSSTHIPSGSTGLDGVWLDDTPVMNEEMVYPHLADWYWSFGSRPGVTADGTPYFVGGITDTFGGSTDNRGLFYGLDAAPLLLGGDALPGLPGVLSASSTISFDYRFSALGTNHLGEITMDGFTSTDDNAMVLNGAGLTLGGSLVRENSPVPAEIGGLAGELWDNFDYLGITENGQWMMTGDTAGGDSAVDEFLLVDGQIILREGDTLPSGHVITSTISEGYMNEDGDWAVAWNVDIGGSNKEAIIVNGELLIAETFMVDWDGDGVLDENAILDDITGIAALAVGDRGPDGAFDVYFTGDVILDGTTELEAGFVMTVPAALGACCIEGECVATTLEDECLAMGGDWYAGEECPFFLCPGSTHGMFEAFVMGPGMLEPGLYNNGWQDPDTGDRWFFYPWYEWWNEWWPNEYTLMGEKWFIIEGFIEMMMPGFPVEVAVNWAWPEWTELGMGRPPLPWDFMEPWEEDMYIGREIVWVAMDPGPFYVEFYLPFCPEWISIDVRGFEFYIIGDIWHICYPFFWPIGDMNCDGEVNFFDIDGFVLAIIDPAAYWAMYPECDIMNADCNGDGAVDFFDIDCFVALIVGAG